MFHGEHKPPTRTHSHGLVKMVPCGLMAGAVAAGAVAAGGGEFARAIGTKCCSSLEQFF